ncbi:MAG TPA: hypothetical protein VHW69_13505 [Rhizomicrobium sp.]|nr:hypothetical protein [Rhizomicrobium sp.]
MSPWQTQRSDIESGRGEMIALIANGQPLTFADVIAGWRNDTGFRDLFIAELAASPYAAFFWELPALSLAALSNPFECVVIRSEALTDMRADPSDFAEYLKPTAGTVVSFRNLGGDAVLVVPGRFQDWIAMVTLPRSFARRRANSSTLCFRYSQTRQKTCWKERVASGSAPRASACRGYMSGWIRIPNTTSTAAMQRDSGRS